MTGAAIVRVLVYRYDLSYVHGRYVMSGGREITTLASTVVEVVTASGVCGFGEVCPLGSNYLPGFAAGAMAAITEVAPALIGVDVTNPAAVTEAMEQAIRGHGYAKSALDIACWDAFGRVVDLPVASLLGGVCQSSFPLYIAVPMGSPDEMAAHVRTARAEGVSRFQLKVGGTVDDDLARIRAVLAATRGDDLVIADANGGWRQADALAAVVALEGSTRLMLEQPCPTLEECLAVRPFARLPMVLDELITDLGTLVRCHQAGAMDAINLKVSRVGGLGPARTIRDVAAQLGLKVTVEDTWGGDLVTAAVSHLAASTPKGALLNVSFMNDWTAEHVAGHQPRSRRGIGRVPDQAGLGITVDRSLLGPVVWQTP
jgi:cis-L-3-hydroxyproline dehydratase